VTNANCNAEWKVRVIVVGEGATVGEGAIAMEVRSIVVG
jgi:hypothetical protein